MPSDYEIFVDTWCGDIDSLSPEISHTVEIVRKELERSPNSTVLRLSSNLLSDLTPLENLTNLRELYLESNLRE